jgi:hypothetical protein
MPICDRCGEEIEFRYMDGRPTPIHVNGGWCEGSKTVPRKGSAKPFASPESYTDPNALCPVCGASVFFYQNVHGSRVFFDDLGWPWPKHPCTDNPEAQSGHISRPKRKKGRTAGRAGSFAIYELVQMSEVGGALTLKFRNMRTPLFVRTLQILASALWSQGWGQDDLREAPSFVLKIYSNATTAEFISIRKHCIGRIVFRVKKEGSESGAE